MESSDVWRGHPLIILDYNWMLQEKTCKLYIHDLLWWPTCAWVMWFCFDHFSLAGLASLKFVTSFYHRDVGRSCISKLKIVTKCGSEALTLSLVAMSFLKHSWNCFKNISKWNEMEWNRNLFKNHELFFQALGLQFIINLCIVYMWVVKNSQKI